MSNPATEAALNRSGLTISRRDDVAMTHVALRRGRRADLDARVSATLGLTLPDTSRTVEAAAAAHEPHRIAFYLYDLASDFHALWNKGKESPQLRFILASDMQTSLARLALLRVIRYVLANGLGILGVKPVGEM